METEHEHVFFSSSKIDIFSKESITARKSLLTTGCGESWLCTSFPSFYTVYRVYRHGVPDLSGPFFLKILQFLTKILKTFF